MAVKPFLLVATRAEDDVADQEYASFCRFGQLQPEQLVRLRLEQAPMPALDLDDFSGVIVGGSPFSTSDPAHEKSDVQHRVESDLARLLDDVVAADVPFLGACYGVGTLGVHQGGLVDRTYGEPVGAVTVELTEEGRRDPVLGWLPSTFQAFVGHKEALTRPPEHAVVLATSATCPVQAFRVKENLYATQFHPELDLTGIVARVEAYQDAGYFPPSELGAVVSRLRRANVVHPPEILAAFVRRYVRS